MIAGDERAARLLEQHRMVVGVSRCPDDGHRATPEVEDLAVSDRVDQILAHHADRLIETMNAVGGGGRTAYEICGTLFPVLRSPHEERFALAETLAHLVYLELRGQARQSDGRPITWSVV